MDELPRENIRLYEKYEDIIDKEIGKRIFRWTLFSLAYISLDDISQLLHLHIARKIHLFDPLKAAFPNWANRLISNQLKNLMRNHYQSMAKPCNRCPYNGGGSTCAIFGTHSQQCLDYAKWFGGKRYKMEINIAHSISAPRLTAEHDQIHQEINDKTSDFTNFDKKIPEFNNLLKQKLRPLEWKAYTLLFIEHLTDLQAARQLNYSVEGGKASVGYKTIAKLKTKIYKVSQQVVKDMDF